MRDVAVALTENHVLLSRFAARITGARDRKLRNALFDDLAKAVGGHCVALEAAVVPRLIHAPSCRLGSDVLIGLVSLKRRLAALLAMDRKTAEFDAGVLVFCDEVEQQADREQLQLLPVLREALSPAERSALAFDVADYMRLRLGDHPALSIALPMQAPPSTPREGVEEAALVLRTLASQRAPSDARAAQKGDEASRV